MTRQERNNEMIARFIGDYNVHEVDGRYRCNCGHEYSAMMSDEDIPMIHTDCIPDIGRYHVDWNQLMYVVEHIYQEGYSGGAVSDLRDALFTGNIEKVYEEVVAYIKWHNEYESNKSLSQ